MSKYVKLFNTHTEYQTYIDGDNVLKKDLTLSTRKGLTNLT